MTISPPDPLDPHESAAAANAADTAAMTRIDERFSNIASLLIMSAFAELSYGFHEFRSTPGCD